jgi:histidinol phosphatase-like PHP family hydrolase
MKIDLHCHTKYSGDNYLEPEELIEQALRIRLRRSSFLSHHEPYQKGATFFARSTLLTKG